MLTIGFDSNSLKYLTASFFATYCSGLTHPLDVIKTRLQSNNRKYLGHDGKQGSDNLVPKYNSLKEAFSRIYNEEGLRGLFKGFYISLACQATAISLFFWMYIPFHAATKWEKECMRSVGTKKWTRWLPPALRPASFRLWLPSPCGSLRPEWCSIAVKTSRNSKTSRCRPKRSTDSMESKVF